VKPGFGGAACQIDGDDTVIVGIGHQQAVIAIGGETSRFAERQAQGIDASKALVQIAHGASCQIDQTQSIVIAVGDDYAMAIEHGKAERML
jgi:hypothetical protein